MLTECLNRTESEPINIRGELSSCQRELYPYVAHEVSTIIPEHYFGMQANFCPDELSRTFILNLAIDKFSTRWRNYYNDSSRDLLWHVISVNLITEKRKIINKQKKLKEK